MAESRDAALTRNVLAILNSLDRHEIGAVDDQQWRDFSRDPCRAFLIMDDDRRKALWAAIQERLPATLREGAIA